ncbi:hypothetical protein KAI60_04660 [Candidatus Bathyarchaeota archaeon]|nr:hypothetical protein [Candidatus Bathyarchaeota archaeon]
MLKSTSHIIINSKKNHTCGEKIALSSILSSGGVLWDFIIDIIAGETVFGLPTGIPMIAIFIIGLILGVLLWKMLKMAIILSILVGIGMYFGVVGSGFIGDVRDLLMNYGPQAIQLAALVIGILPLGLGIAAGFVIGLLKG